MPRFYNEFNFALTPAQRAERNKLCEDIVLAHQLAGTPVWEITKALFRDLPSDHWLLKSSYARRSFQRQLDHQFDLTKAENREYKKAHV